MVETKEVKRIRPQEGYQMKALSSPADIVFGGAGAGVGKTYCLLLEFLRHIKNPQWGGVIFRRTSPQISSEGGLWDTSENLYPHAGGVPVKSNLRWDFPSGAKLKFSHMEYEKDKINWQGSQIPFIGFDELTHFTESMFFYLLSRSRSTCGVKPYVRATCNPDPESWVANIISWWIDQETGYPIPERDGVVRFFYRDGNNYVWGADKSEVLEKAGHLIYPMAEKSNTNPEIYIKSFTFISGSIYDNRELISINPEYLANLASQDEATKAQLLDGNWKVKVSDQEIYDYYRFIQIFDREPVTKTNPKSYVTADIAMKGSNKLIIGGWIENHLQEIEVIDKSNGKEVVDAIQRIQKKLNVPNNHVAFDADGVGSYIDGYIVGAIPFNNGSSPIGTIPNSRDKPNYPNLKTQCYYESANDVNNGLFSVDSNVWSKMYDNKMTIKQRFIYERKAIKRAKADNDGKLMIIPKEQMKLLLDGDSPDLMDMFMMRKLFDLKPKFEFYVT